NAVTEKFETAKEIYGSEFEELFLRETRGALTWWAWVTGSNVMRNAIIIFSLFGHFDYFAFLNIASYALFHLAGRIQINADSRVLAQVELWDLNPSGTRKSLPQKK